MQDKQAAMWFEENSTIYCEREFVSVEGKTLRPDRVIVNHDKVVVVDYKTGKQLARHADQVTVYKQELQSIYKKPVEGYLLYTEGPTIMAV
jgi:ATP-dependent exoDNAse (exonuclease V) beta subunit